MNTREGSTNANEKPSTTCVPTRQQARTGERVREQDGQGCQTPKEGIPAESAQIAFFNWQRKQGGEIIMTGTVKRIGAKSAIVSFDMEVDGGFHSFDFIVPLHVLPHRVLWGLHLSETACIERIEDFNEIFDFNYDRTKMAKVTLELKNQQIHNNRGKE